MNFPTLNLLTPFSLSLQLRPSAVGLLTLGPTTVKDKLMQAAGRLRMLGRGQKLRFAATADVAAKIRLGRRPHPPLDTQVAPGALQVLQVWIN